MGREAPNGLSGCSLPELVYTTFPKNFGRGESLDTTTCLESVVLGKQGHAPGKII